MIIGKFAVATTELMARWGNEGSKSVGGASRRNEEQKNCSIEFYEIFMEFYGFCLVAVVLSS
jgi:hypothetical protein